MSAPTRFAFLPGPPDRDAMRAKLNDFAEDGLPAVRLTVVDNSHTPPLTYAETPQ